MALCFVSAGDICIVDTTLWEICDFFFLMEASNNLVDFGSMNLPVAESPFKWLQSRAYFLILPPSFSVK